ncbi:Transcription factor bHLH93 [Heracleum sosnowskyi]|uniref:Transcription factor bHLH93 n=1 Tax=Heracleum sosnowskyi TaxID=360622 RepID=A0AAD8GPB9_9APIA|nr:Transcription factor bHLH93 [Heracleum sosnowskyi]
METSQHALFEDFLSAPPPAAGNEQQFFPSYLSCGSFYESLDVATSNVSFSELITSSQVEFPNFAFPFNEFCPFTNAYPGGPEDVIDSSYLIKNDQPPFPVLQDHDYKFRPVEGEQVLEFPSNDLRDNHEKDQASKENVQVFNVGSSDQDRKRKSTKIEGQPSKNLMAERRRRKRLNDRLSMLRSIVPKISKMDRTSIVGDTIDYVKDLQEKIHKLKEEVDTEWESNQMNMVGSLNENTNEVIPKSPSKFDVARREESTRIEICCAAKPGLLLSTVDTIEALGLDIQQCVISCFSDFSMQASCSEAVDNRKFIGCEDMKQELYRNAGYGGRCF